VDFLHRLLDLVQRELSASDARVEIGGRDPVDPRLVWSKLPEQGWRVVAVLEEPPDDPDELRTRLDQLVGAFGETATRSLSERPPPATGSVAHVIDDELAALAFRARAREAVIVDTSSPIVWASSELARTDDENVDVLIETATAADQARDAGIDFIEILVRTTEDAARFLRDAGVPDDPADAALRAARRLRDVSPERDAKAWSDHLLVARATSTVLSQGAGEHRLVAQAEGFGYLARTIADIYRLILAFDGPFSELHAEAAAVHAHHYLERLLAALPPRDPGTGSGGPRKGNVIRLPRP
jgi:hypothetical protein